MPKPTVSSIGYAKLYNWYNCTTVYMSPTSTDTIVPIDMCVQTKPAEIIIYMLSL